MIPKTLFIFLAAGVLLLAVVARSRSPRRWMYFNLVFAALAAGALALCRRAGITGQVEPLLVILGCGGLVMAAGTIFNRDDEEAAASKRSSARAKISETPPDSGVAYIATEFPQQNHTPLQREIAALVARGLAPTVFSLRTVRAESLAPSTRSYLDRTVAARAFFSAALLGAQPALGGGAPGVVLRRAGRVAAAVFVIPAVHVARAGGLPASRVLRRRRAARRSNASPRAHGRFARGLRDGRRASARRDLVDGRARR